MNVSAVIVTRGDVDLSPVLDSLPPAWERVIWNNAVEQDLAVYGRYAGIERASGDLIYVQDDDAILAPEAFDVLLAAYQPGHVVCNMPERFRHEGYVDSALVGFGALFACDLPERSFARMANGEVDDPPPYPESIRLFHRTCDVVFTTLTPRILVDVPYADREFASDPGRMWTSDGHVSERARMLALARQVRDAEDPLVAAFPGFDFSRGGVRMPPPPNPDAYREAIDFITRDETV